MKINLDANIPKVKKKGQYFSKKDQGLGKEIEKFPKWNHKKTKKKICSRIIS